MSTVGSARGGAKRAGALVTGFAALATACVSPLPVSERSETLRAVLPSTVQLLGERAAGGRRAASGVVFASDSAARRSLVLTTKHFLAPPAPETISVRVPSRGERFRATILRTDPDSDLAVIQVDGPALSPVRLKDVVRLGDDVWVVAFPRGRQMTVVSGTVSQILSADGDALSEGPVRMIDASVSYGASGGGVFDTVTGALVGIVEGYRTAQIAARDAPDRILEVPIPGETLVISAQRIRQFLVAAGLAEDFSR